jgi:hypothetical protein
MVPSSESSKRLPCLVEVKTLKYFIIDVIQMQVPFACQLCGWSKSLWGNDLIFPFSYVSFPSVNMDCVG